MARSNNSLKFLAAAVAVVGVAFCAGYFLIGGRQTTPTTPETVVTQNTPKNTPAPAKPAIASTTPRTKNSDYSAPGAPRIQIVEEKNPSLIDTSKLQPTPDPTTPSTPDAEASQEATPPPPVQNSDPAPDLNTNPANGNGTDTSGAAPATGTNDTTTTGTTPDPDVEQPGAPPSDPNAAPDGTESNKPQYRVQTGSFVTADNARALADALHRRGYTTSTRTERDGDKTVYKVQIGAYRTRSAADKAAQDLQSSGYPADVSPVGP